MSETLVRLSGVPEEILSELVGSGFYKTKSEAIRAALLLIGKEYNLINEDLLAAIKIRKLEEKYKKGELKTEPLKQAMEKYA